MTHALLPGSPAIDKGNPSAIAGVGITPQFDQRGFARIINGDSVPGARLDIGASESPPALIGDFDGDHRDDQLQFDAGTGTVLVVTNRSGVPLIKKWGQVDDSIAWTNPQVGDFNGDGRDDLFTQNDTTDDRWTVLISDGNAFFSKNTNVVGAWSQIYVGDFNDDGSQELLGKLSNGTWQVLRYSDAAGARLDTITGTQPTPTGTVFVGDANRDGRDDLIFRNSETDWSVALAEGGGASFTSAVSWGGWFEDEYDDSILKGAKFNPDAPYEKVLDIFSDIYNNYELELYPGLMKGPDATEQTKAGNDWDQAALLEKKLQAAGIDAKIATGTTSADGPIVAQWVGAETPEAAREILKASLHSGASLSGSTGKISFKHAWVQAWLPTANGFAYVNLDPSWKFKNRQDGIDLAETAFNGAFGNGIFNEYAYLSLDPQTDRRLPLEFFEDQVMDYLASTPLHQGKSLSDVPKDGSIIQKSFDVFPGGTGTSLGTGISVVSTITTYDDAEFIYDMYDINVTASQLTHKAIISLYKGSEMFWDHTLVVPERSLDSIVISFASSFADVGVPGQPETGKFASPTAEQFFGRLVINGTVIQAAESTELFGLSETVTIKVQHLNARGLLNTVPTSTNLTYTRKPYNIVSIGLDANQYSRESLTLLQEEAIVDAGALTAKLKPETNNATSNDIGTAVSSLLSYSVAKYWADLNRDMKVIAGLTNTVEVQQRVGSGVTTADVAVLEFDTTPNSPGGEVKFIEHLNYGFAPAGMGIDLPNAVIEFRSSGQGTLNDEAFRFGGYNASAREHNIVEETIYTESISTMKGLQRAYQKNLGVDGSNNPIADDSILVFERTAAGIKQYIGEFNLDGSNVGQVAMPMESAQDIALKIPRHAVGGVNHTATSIWTELSAAPTNEVVRVLVPKSKSQVGNWIGSVYVRERPSNGLYAIAKDGQTFNGGFGGDQVSQQNPTLPPAAFPFASYAGDPVNTANGNMFRDDVDIVFPNLGVPLDFARHYDSNSKDDLGLGVGWVYSFGDVLIADPAGETGDLIWITASGQRHKFEYVSPGVYNEPAELHGVFTYSATTDEFSYKDKSGLEYHFGEITGTQGSFTLKGRLTKQIDNIGNGVVITHDGSTTKIQQVQDVHAVGTNNRRLVFTYPGNNLSSIAKYNTTLEGTWNFNYESISVPNVASSQRLISVLAPSVSIVSPTGSTAPSRPTTSYGYYQSGHSKGVIELITEPDGGVHKYEYFPNGRVFRVKDNFSDSLANVQSFNYNLFRGSTEFVDENGNSETYFHQENGLLTKQIHDDRTRQEFTWGATGPLEFLMTSSTDEVGAVETFAYYSTPSDFRYRELYESTEKQFPGNSNPLVTRFDYSSPGGNKAHMINLASTIVDPGDVTHQNLTTRFDYDPEGLGRMWTTTDAMGNVTSRTYYANDTSPQGGLFKTETSARGNDTSTASAPNKEYVPWEVLNSGFNVSTGTLTVRVKVRDGDLSTGEYIYADAIRIDRIGSEYPYTQIIDDDNDTSNGRFASVGGVSYFSGYSVYFDSDRTALSGVGQEAIWTFSGLEAGTYKVSATWYEEPPGSTRSDTVAYELFDGTTSSTAVPVPLKNQKQAPTGPGPGFITTFTYDAAGNVVSTTTDGIQTSLNAYHHTGQIESTTSIPGSVASEATYNVIGWQTDARIDPSDASSDLASQFAYDAMGRLRESTDPLGRITKFEYDAKGKLVKQINADGTEIEYDYDPFGNRTSVTDELGRTTRFVYDGHSRLVQTIYCDGTSTHIRYNGVGQVVASVDALGHETTFTYDAVGRLLATTRVRTEVGTANITATNSYDHVGRLEHSLDFEGNRTDFKYDKLSRVIESRSLASDGNSILALTTTDYDANGNVIRVVRYDAAALGHLPNDLDDPRTYINAQNKIDNKIQVSEFRYDSLNRPIETINADGTATRTVYDNAGRVLFQYDELNRKTKFEYDVYGRLSKTVAPDPDGPSSPLASPITQHQYDAAGNRIAVIDPNQNKTHFEYDTRNRLVSSTDALGGQTHTLYDIAGRVVASVNALGQTMYTLRDKRGRAILQREADPDGDGELTAPQTRFKYDVVGNLKEKIDALGYATSYEYDNLNRLVEESFYQSYLLDDGDGLPGYKTLTGTGTSIADAAAVGGSYTSIAPELIHGIAMAQWRFFNLPPGTYRVAATWRASDQASSLAQVQFRTVDDGVPTGLAPQSVRFDQQSDPDDFYLADGGQWRGWDVTNSLVVEGDGVDEFEMRVRRTSDTAHVLADAVRLDRLVTRTYTYDDNGNLETETDTLGRVTDYDYDALNRQTKVTLPDPDGTGVGNPSPQTTTVYDGYGNVKEIIEDRGGTVHERTTKYTYDSRNRVTLETLDKGGAEEVSTLYDYDDVGNLILKIEDYAAISSGHVFAGTTYEYDALNRQIVENRFRDLGDSLPLRTFTTYDAAGNVTRTTEVTRYNDGGTILSHESITEFTYDALNRLVGEAEIESRVIDDGQAGFNVNIGTSAGTTTGYLGDGLLIDKGSGGTASAKWMFSDLTPGTYRVLATWAGHAAGAPSSFAYLHDGIVGGSPLAVTAGPQTVAAGDIVLPDANGLSRGWRLFAETFAVTPANGNQLTVVYSTAGQLLQADAVRLERVVSKNTFTYDAVGNLIAETNPNGHVTVSEYDRLNRLEKTTAPDPDGNWSTDNTPFTTYAYDAVGQLVRETNGEGEFRTYGYDSLGNLTREVDGEGHATFSTYDSEGNLLTYTDREGHVTTYTYDGLNRLKTDTITLDGLPAQRTYTYDAQGNLYNKSDRDGRLTYYAYDRLDRMEYEIWYTADGISHPHTIVYQYDKLGRVTLSRDIDFVDSAIESERNQSFEYDDLNRVLKERNYHPGLTTTAPKVEQRYEYDVLGAADWVSYVRTEYSQWSMPSGGTPALIGMTTTFVDRQGRVARIEDIAAGGTTKRVDYTYDDADQLIDVARTSGSFFFDTRYDYDNAGRVTEIEHLRDSATTPFTSYEYSYDLADRITGQFTAHDTSIAAFPAGSALRVQSFGFDDAGQLLDNYSFVYGYEESFEYDANGNRVGTNISTGAYNRLSGDANYTYQYDKEGNRIRKTARVGDAYTVYTWDHRNRLTKVEDFTSSSVIDQRMVYAYSADDQLVLRDHELQGMGPFFPIVEHYVNNGVDRALTFDGNNVVKRRYVQGPLTDQLLFDEVFNAAGQQTGFFAPVTDHLGTVRAVLNEAEAVHQFIEYNSFGEVTEIRDVNGDLVATRFLGGPPQPDTSALDTVYSFAGRPLDSLTGFTHNRARWYDPSTGRFINEDPAQDGSNWYAYAGNDPINNYDPTGLSIAKPTDNLYGGYGGGKISKAPPPVTYTPPAVSMSTVLRSVGNAAANVASSAFKAFNPLATTVVKAGLSVGASSFLGKPPTVDPSVRQAYDQLGPVDRFFGFFAGVGKQYDINEALNHQQQATDPNRLLRAGDIGTALGGNSQYSVTGHGVATIKEFGRETTTNIGTEIITAGAGGVFGRADDVNDLRKASNAVTHGHHPLPKFLGGNPGQILSKVEPAVHREFHSLLNQNLKKAGIPLNVGGRGGSTRDWAEYMARNPSAQQKAFDAVLDTSRAVDVKHGTNVTQNVWQNIHQGNFTAQP